VLFLVYLDFTTPNANIVLLVFTKMVNDFFIPPLEPSPGMFYTPVEQD